MANKAQKTNRKAFTRQQQISHGKPFPRNKEINVSTKIGNPIEGATNVGDPKGRK